MSVKLCICLILGLLTWSKSYRGYDSWSFYAGNKQVEIKMPTSFHCYYECKTEYMDYICMFMSGTISSKNILIAAYGSSTLNINFDNTLSTNDSIIHRDSTYTVAYNTKEQNYYIRKFFPKADFCFSAIRVDKGSLPMIDSISKTIDIRELSRPINVSPILKSPSSAKDWETRRVLL